MSSIGSPRAVRIQMVDSRFFEFPPGSVRPTRGCATRVGLGYNVRARHRGGLGGNNDRMPRTFTLLYARDDHSWTRIREARHLAGSIKERPKVLPRSAVIALATAVNCLRPNRSP